MLIVKTQFRQALEMLLDLSTTPEPIINSTCILFVYYLIAFANKVNLYANLFLPSHQRIIYTWKKHGDILHPGWDSPEIAPDEEIVVMHLKGELRLRRWKHLHFEDFADTVLDVVRIDHPDYEKPLLLGTIARELTTEQIWLGYKHRFPVETNFYVAQDSAGMEMPRAWTENAIKRRISLAMLAGFVLKAIAANCEPLPIGPWDLRPQPTAGRLANYLDIQIPNFVALALAGVKSRNYQKTQTPHNSKDLPFPDAA